MTQLPTEGPVTVMFTDVEESTEITARIGDEGWRDFLNKHHETVRKVTAEHGGHEIKSLGDGLMIAFTSARKAIQAAVAIQAALAGAGSREAKFRLRIGINTGEVVQDEEDLLGTAVNVASRIAARAEGGQILAAEVVKQLVGTLPGVEFRDRGRVALKGIADRLRIFEVIALRGRDEPLSRRTEFVGRDEERAELRAHLESALSGNGRVVLIGGEPGIGKTRLAQEIAAEARDRGAMTLLGHSYESESPLPYGPWVEMTNTVARVAPPKLFRELLGDDAPEIARLVPELRRVFPDIPAPVRLPPEQEREYVLTSVLNYLERSCRLQPLVLTLDDLQWADDASLLLLMRVAQQVSEMAMLVIGTYRDIELEVGRPLAKTLEDLLRRRLAERVSLRRLSEEAVGNLLTALGPSEQPPPALTKIIFRETEGNPFFVEEVFQHLREEGKVLNEKGGWRTDLEIADFEVPESIRLVIGRRLERLEEKTRNILTTASLIGGSFGFELLEELEGDDPDLLVDALDDAENAHLISSARRGNQTRITFAHELIRQTLLSGVSLPKRQRLHLRIAEAMEKIYGDRLLDRAVDVAHHLYQAAGSADPEKTVRYLSLAGDLAITSTAFVEAVRHYEQALEFHTGEDEKSLADLKFRLGFAQRAIGRWDLALGLWNEVLSSYEKKNDPTAARVARAVAYQLSWEGKTEESLEVARRGLAAIPPEPSRERARLLAVAAMTTGLLGDPEAYDMIGEATLLAEDLGNERDRLEVLSSKAVIEWGYARWIECYAASAEAAEGFQKRGDLFQYAGVAPFVEHSLTGMGKFDEADEFGSVFEPTALRLGHLGALVPHMRSTQYRSYERSGNLDELDRAADQDMEIVLQLGGAWLGQSQTFKALSLYRRGKWEEALDLAASGVNLEYPGVYEGMGRGLKATLDLLLGNRDESFREFIDLEPPSRQSPTPNGRQMLIRAAVELWALAGERRAGAFYDFLTESIERKAIFSFYDARPVHLDAALAAAARDDWAAAERHFNDTIELVNELGLGFQQAEARRLWASALKNWAPKRSDEIRTLQQDAAGHYARLGMVRHEESMKAELAKT